MILYALCAVVGVLPGPCAVAAPTIVLEHNQALLVGSCTEATPHTNNGGQPVLGTLINFMGLRRVWTRGIKNANKFMLGAAIACNLKKWLNYQEQKR